MAIDKAVDSSQLNSDLTSVANAIRAKSGGSSQLAFPSGFVSEIQAIPSGGGGWTTDGIINGTEPSGALVSNATRLRSNLFTGNTGITSVSLPMCNGGGGAVFQNCPNIVSVSMPSETTFYSRNNFFENCSKCTSFYLPLATIIGSYQFKGCAVLPYIVLPSVTQIYNEALMNCAALVGADFGPSLVFERTGIFKNDANLKTIILRKTSVVQLKVLDAFNGTPFANGGSGGTIYIPKSLYDHLGDGTSSDYQAATNWSTLHGYGTITWAKIEGSIYETKYVDGSDIPTS